MMSAVKRIPKVLCHSAKLIVFGYCLVLGLAPDGASHAQEWTYTVRPGDNLWDLSEKYLVDLRYWRRLQDLNQVQNPRRLTPGQRLRFPVAWLKIQPAPVRVIQEQGEAEVTSAVTGMTLPVKQGLRLFAGDTIRTGPDTSVLLEFADGSQFLLLSNSYLTLDTISAYGDTGMVDTQLRLRRGRIDSQIAPSKGPATRFEIQTPAATTAVRGTDYRISMQPERALSRTEVLAGRVLVRGGNRTRSVAKNFGTVTETGKPPTPPIRLLPPPDVAGFPEVIDRIPIAFTLPPLPNAVAYRLQIALNRGFDNLLFDRLFDTPQLSAPYPQEDENYVLRVRGIDGQGLEGRDAYHSFEIDAFPEPPVLLRPEPDAIVRVEQPEFSWSAPVDAESYHFQLAASDDFDTPIADLPNYEDTDFTPATSLATGDYYWRVATTDASAETGPFSDPQHFTVQPPPASPELQPPDLDDDTLTLRWRQGLPGQSYRFQLARDRWFDHILVDEQVNRSQVTLSRPSSGYYYLRIKTIGADGYSGPYGSPQRITVPPANYWPFSLFALIALMLLL